ncbi:hypothetical protein F3Y22_tig00111238pilonHSYRG00433 [Hibiscus syriacus]|uniref:Pentatricopeptide repeat-containing protein n=1 Tax=Hibiscus syriacus TaxID=106335 RepID=A0A6A2YTB3_HIBSY|nr:hypothetical protein F3Y22_tig00111238pilonHSYRG00433 [Hibiscus syriacus]
MLCGERGSNTRPSDLQSDALPTELSPLDAKFMERVAATFQLETPTTEDLSWRRTMCNNSWVSYLHAVLHLCARNKAAVPGKAYHAREPVSGCKKTLQHPTFSLICIPNLFFCPRARRVFDGMPRRSLASWITLIVSYAQNREAHEALSVFKLMLTNVSSFSEFNVSSILCASVEICAASLCKQLHGFSLKASVVTNMFVGKGC